MSNINSNTGLNRFGRMMQDYLVNQVRQTSKAACQRVENLKTKEDALSYVKEARKMAQECFGKFPKRTALNAKTTGTVNRDSYTIEKVLFESRPGMLVTGNLYLPKNGNAKNPCVLGLCGHSAEGKAAQAYQSFCQGLAQKGYVVFIIDPIGQGERYQYLDDNGELEVGAPTSEHILCGNQQALVGEFFGSWRAWDGIRALDYLLERREVDTNHVGVTGNSGGGTMTTWLVALDERITMAAPGCFVTTFLRDIENEEIQDSEQCPPKSLSQAMEHETFLAALAPNPLIILAQEKDFFDVRGAEEAIVRLKKLYKLLGFEENVELFVGPQTHGYKIENREAMYRWFNKGASNNEDYKEPKITIEDAKTLQVTNSGQVGLEGSKTVFEFTREKAQQLDSKREKLSGKQLKKVIAEQLKLSSVIDTKPSAPDYRILRSMKKEDGKPEEFLSTYLLNVEEGIDIPLYHPTDYNCRNRPEAKQCAILYICDKSADIELSNEPLIEKLYSSEPDTSFFACDVRGVGESAPTTGGRGPWTTYGGDYFYAACSIMLDKPYVGQKTFDCLCAIYWLKEIGFKNIHLVANGWGTVPATFATLLSDDVDKVTLKNPLESYLKITQEKYYDWPLSSFVFGAIKHFDLPLVYQQLESKNLQII